MTSPCSQDFDVFDAAGIDTSKQETYKPGSWIDPDGCQHYVMDDGIEGYMTPVRTPDGRPVCNRRNVCVSPPQGNLAWNDRLANSRLEIL